MSDFYAFKRSLECVSSVDRDGSLRALADRLARIQRRWPRAVDLSGLLPNCALAIFPLFFIDAFGSIDDERLVPFLSGCNLLATSLMVADTLYDDPLDRTQTRAQLLCWHGLQFEFQREFADVFATRSPFWAELQAALAEHLRGIVCESTYVRGRRELADATVEECLAMARAKSCVARIAIVGLSLLGDERSRTAALLVSLDRYNLARQIWDDLQDWKDDLACRRATLVTRRLAAACAQTPTAEPRALARALYYGGHASDLLETARAALVEARELADPLRRLPWHGLIDDLARSVAALTQDVRTIVARHEQRAVGGAVPA